MKITVVYDRASERYRIDIRPMPTDYLVIAAFKGFPACIYHYTSLESTREAFDWWANVLKWRGPFVPISPWPQAPPTTSKRKANVNSQERANRQVASSSSARGIDVLEFLCIVSALALAAAWVTNWSILMLVSLSLSVGMALVYGIVAHQRSPQREGYLWSIFGIAVGFIASIIIAVVVVRIIFAIISIINHS